MFGDTSCGRAVLAVIRQLAPLALSPAHLVTGRTARLQSLGVVAAAVEGPVLVEVDEVHHQLLQQGGGGREGPGGQTGLEVTHLTDGAVEASGMPHLGRASSGGRDTDVPSHYGVPALQEK